MESSKHIHVLDRAVAERIAAGEVVERPASVVKELVENAIDAGATAIAVEIREGGVALIRVSDNGCGMTRQDVALALQRFATSKIASVDDLSAIKTLGFRGEALPSIAAVSHVEILTRTADDIEGARARAGDGRVEVEPAGAPIGTQVSVRNLFYNAPARRKFLKSPLRETELIHKTLVTYALAYPQIAFRFVADGRESFVWAAVTPLERIGAAWGYDVAAEMIPVNYTSLDLRVRGFVSKPTLARAGREWQTFFVNGRPIRAGLLAVMLERPYAGRLPPAVHRYPLAVLWLDLDPRLVDVNVHPRKAEVRFYQERAVYGAVSQAVSEALREFPLTQAGAVDWSFAAASDAGGWMLREPGVEYGGGPLWRAIGQIHNTFILAQSAEGLVIVDQHAAQEQIFYERLTANVARSPLANVQIHLTPREAELLNERLDEYRSLGLDIEPFGQNTFRVMAAPEFVRLDPAELVMALIQEHERFRSLEGDALRDKLAARAACLCAIKAGDALDILQQQALLDELAQTYSPATCPHGRPAFVSLTLEELERRFSRR